MNVEFKMGRVTFGTEDGRVEKDLELVTLSGGCLGKDAVTRPVTADDRFLYEDEYAAFRKSLLPPSAPVSGGALSSVPAAGADATGAEDTKPPLTG